VGRCIFCKSTAGPFRTREHILPESLGAGDWAILPEGLFCDSCQNRFGSAIEQQSLDDYPFSLLRTFIGIPTKKSKAPWFASWEGRVCGSGVPGLFHFDPAPPFAQAMHDGTKTQIRVIAEPKRPDMICRTLLKMGIEAVAADNVTDVFSTRFDAARRYALDGAKDGEWWYLQREDLTQAAKLFEGQPIVGREPFQLETCDIGDGAEVFHLHLFYLDLFVPLEQRIIPHLATLPEPEYRLFGV
jgi:HNH endonuclease